jgi:hypothetical protein
MSLVDCCPTFPVEEALVVSMTCVLLSVSLLIWRTCRQSPETIEGWSSFLQQLDWSTHLYSRRWSWDESCRESDGLGLFVRSIRLWSTDCNCDVMVSKVSFPLLLTYENFIRIAQSLVMVRTFSGSAAISFVFTAISCSISAAFCCNNGFCSLRVYICAARSLSCVPSVSISSFKVCTLSLHSIIFNAKATSYLPSSELSSIVRNSSSAVSSWSSFTTS